MEKYRGRGEKEDRKGEERRKGKRIKRRQWKKGGRGKERKIFCDVGLLFGIKY